MAKRPRAPLSATNSNAPYCPDRFDIVFLDFDPQAGREQAGRRPAFVLSPRKYNSIARLCIVCPITSQGKGYPFEVAIPDGLPVTGYILSDHVKSLSWEARNASFVASCGDLADETLGKLRALLGV